MSYEINLINTWAKQFEPDAVLAKSPTDNSQPTAPTDVTAAGDPACGPITRIVNFGDRPAISSSALAVERAGCTLIQSLMRPFVIVVANPARGAPLLSAGVSCGWRGDLGLINSMHLFMSRVILRLAWTSELDPDFQCQKPCRQSGQIQRSIASEGAAVVHANDFGLAVAYKKSLKIAPYRLMFVGQQTNTQHEATEQIAHGQWIHALSIASAKPTLEIDGPNVVGRRWDRQWTARKPWSPARPSAARLRQFQTLQPIGNRAHFWQGGAWMLVSESDVDLLGSPSGMFAPRLGDRSDPASSCATRRALGTSGTVLQTWTTLCVKTPQPFETSFAADMVLSTELGHRFETALSGLYKALPRFCKRRSFPRHDRRKLQSKTKNRNLCPCPQPSPM